MARTDTHPGQEDGAFLGAFEGIDDMFTDGTIDFNDGGQPAAFDGKPEFSPSPDDAPKGDDDPPKKDADASDDDPPKKDEDADDDPPEDFDLRPDKKDGDEKPEDDADDAPPEGADEKAGEKWKSLKASERAATAAAKELETKIAELEKRPTDDDVAALKAKVEQLDEELLAWRIQNHPSYREKIKKPVAAIRDQLATTYKALPKLEELLFSNKDMVERERELSAYFAEEDVPDMTRLKIVGMANKLDELYETEQGLWADSKATQERLLKEDADAAATARETDQKEFTAEQERLFPAVAATLSEIDDDELGTAIEELKGNTSFDGFEEDQKSLTNRTFANLAGHLMPVIMAALYRKNAEAAEAKAEVARLHKQKGGAGDGGGGGGKPSAEPKKPRSAGAFTESVDDGFEDVDFSGTQQTGVRAWT
jgi:hypothetical protein